MLGKLEQGQLLSGDLDWSLGTACQGNGSGAGLVSDCLLGFGTALLSLPVKWAINSTCQGFSAETLGPGFTQARLRLEVGLQPAAGRSSCLEGAGGATYRNMAGSTGPGAGGERVGCGGAWSVPGGRQGHPKSGAQVYSWPGTSGQAWIPGRVSHGNGCLSLSPWEIGLLDLIS